MKKIILPLTTLALSASLAAQTTPSYKFKKPIAQLPVQSASGGGSGSGGGSNPPPVLVGELDVSTNSLNFSSVEVGNSQNLSFLVGNFGQASLTLNPVTYLGAGFSANSVCGSSLAVGEDCQVSITFTPTQRGPFNGSATVTSSVGSETVTFTGQGIQASGSLQALTSSDFGAVEVGQSADRSFVYSNTGDAPSRNTYVSTVSAPLSLVSNGCGTVVAPVTLNPGQNCTVSLRYQPTSSSPLSANLTIVSSAENSPISQLLTGQGTQAQGSLVANTSADFGTVTVGQFAERSFTFTNDGTASATNVVVSALTAPLSLINNSCGTAATPVTVAAGQSCAVTVRYSPTTVETLSGRTLTITSSASNSPSTLTISGSSEAAPFASSLILNFNTSLTADSSGNSVSTSVFGGVSLSTDSVSGVYSAEFNGSTGYLSVDGNAFNFVSQDFSVELWFKINQGATSPRARATLFGPNEANRLSNYTVRVLSTSSGGLTGNGGITVWHNNAQVGSMIDTTPLAQNVWHHVSLTRQGGLLRLFVNGTLRASSSSNLVTGTSPVLIGAVKAINSSFDDYFPGKIDNIRVIKNSAIYTSNFTPPVNF